MAERPRLAEEVWLQDSEARLESMEVLLKSVRRDIDALTEKLPSPRITGRAKVPHEESGVVHESGSRDYVIDSGPRCLYNLGLGSHTSFEPFVDEEEVRRGNAELNPFKPWQSPSDLRQTPPSSPTFGESSNIISLHDVILHSENANDSSNYSTEGNPNRLLVVVGSQHSLPTIEENSQEDNTFTDTDTSSISTSEDLKSADCAPHDYRFPPAAVCGSHSFDTVATSDVGSVAAVLTGSKRSLEDTILRKNRPPANLVRPRSGSPFLANPDSVRLSRHSLLSRDSMISEADSFVTVNSQLYPSGEDAYITACSDSEKDDVEDGQTVGRGRRLRTMVLQPTLPTECHNQSDDVLEFTLVEAASSGPPTPDPPQQEGLIKTDLGKTAIPPCHLHSP